MMQEEEADSTIRKAGVRLDQVMARARQAKVSAEPHIRALAGNARKTADLAQLKIAEYRPEAERQIRSGAHRARIVMETARPKLEYVVEQARPRVENAARQARGFVSEHQDEFRQAALEAAEVWTPSVLRPMIHKIAATNQEAEAKKSMQSDSTEYIDQ